jgi:hypothetical protein
MKMTCSVKIHAWTVFGIFAGLKEMNIGRAGRSSWCILVETTNLQQMNYGWCRGRHDNSQMKQAKEQE